MAARHVISILLLSIISKVQALTLGPILPEIPKTKVEKVSSVVSRTLNGNDTEETRKIEVQELTATFGFDSTRTSTTGTCTKYEESQFVYGELSIPTLASLFDAVGVRKNEKFLDIGSGDGALVFAAPLFYGRDVQISRGIEIVPELLERSVRYARAMEVDEIINGEQVQFYCGDIYRCDDDETLTKYLRDTTLAVCFATTWSRGNRGRMLPELSKALGSHLPQDAKVVIVDGRLDERDGFNWVGDLKINCPDTAPYSIASLYEKV